jgi:hypothetical protein
MMAKQWPLRPESQERQARRRRDDNATDSLEERRPTFVFIRNRNRK